MIRKYFTKPFRKWVKKKIEIINKEIDSKDKNKMNPPYTVFYPHSSNSDSYVIPKEIENLEKCELGLPIPPKDLWMGYGSNTVEYLYSGKEQISKMINLINNSGYNFNNSKSILELGCSSGRMIRWLKPFSANKEIWGTDISSEHIYWANNYLNPPFNFATTTTIPHLPFGDRYFDIIYAGSVFTHIDDLADAWFLELKRILTDDGRIYVTIHDRNTIDLIENSEIWKESLLSNLIRKNEIFKNNRNKFGMFVGLRGPDSQIIYDIDYFSKAIKNKFNIVSVTEGAYGYQTGIVLQKP